MFLLLRRRGDVVCSSRKMEIVLRLCCPLVYWGGKGGACGKPEGAGLPHETTAVAFR